MSIHLQQPLKDFLKQSVGEGFTTAQSWQMLVNALETPMPAKTLRKAA